MLFVRWIFQVDGNDPMIDLIILNELGLPVVRQTIPEEAEHVSDYDSQKSHLEDVYDGEDGPIISNLVISVLVSVALLHPVEEQILRDEVARAQARNPQHLEQEQVSKYLLLLLSLIRQEQDPRDCRQRVEQKATIDYIAGRNFFQTGHHIVVLRVTERCEEVLQYFKAKHELAPVEYEPELFILFETEGHDV